MKERRTIHEQDLLEFRRDYLGVELPDFLPARRTGFFLVPEGVGLLVASFLNARRRRKYGDAKVDQDETRYALAKKLRRAEAKKRARRETQRPNAIRHKRAFRRGAMKTSVP
jgi:hypothetical protein